MAQVTVMMATYNGGSFLKQQLQSLYCQTDVDIDIMVRDDGSTDDTIDILESEQSKGRLHYYSGPHCKPAFAFLDLMKHAFKSGNSDYYAFCDQDDVWDNDKLSIAVNAISHFPDRPAIYYCGQRLVDADLNFIKDHILCKERNDHARFLLNDAAGCTVVFNRILLEKVISYDPSYLLMHDTWCVKVCLATGGILHVDPEPHMSYRQHGKNSLGLSNRPGALIKRIYHYVFEQNVEKQMIELKKGYESDLSDEYKDIIDCVLSYRTISSRKRLKNDRWIHFGDNRIRYIFLLKLLIKKL